MTATVERLRIARHHRDHDREQAAHPERRLEQVGAGDLEPRLLVARPHERADHPHAGKGLADQLSIRSIFSCMTRNIGIARLIRTAMTTPMIGTMTRSRPERGEIRPDGHDDPADDQDRRGAR